MRIVDLKAYPTSFRLPPEATVSLGIGRAVKRDAVVDKKKWLRKSEQGDKWNRCLIEGMIVLSETGARDEQTTPP